MLRSLSDLMKILTTLTYYRPHFSGLTVYAELLAHALAAGGHRVTVLTSHYQRDLPAREVLDGMCVIRANVWARVSKGVLMPAMPFLAWKQVCQSDVVHLHLPQLDAAYIALFARLLGKPVVLTYHCDLRLPSGFIHWLANRVSHLANRISCGLANVVAVNTQDYADGSEFLRPYLSKIHPIPPPVALPEVTEADRQAFRQKANVQPGQRIIGMAARLATEKGVEYLVRAMPSILRQYPTARVLYLGQHQNVMGEEAYAQRLAPLIAQLGNHWTFLGSLSNEEKRVFFDTCEVTVLPSLNSTESWGMVQVESMICGTPVVASDLPGVRCPVQMTGMGRVVPSQDAESLAQAVINVLDQPELYRGDPQAVAQRFSPQAIAEEYERLYQQLLTTPREENRTL